MNRALPFKRLFNVMLFSLVMLLLFNLPVLATENDDFKIVNGVLSRYYGDDKVVIVPDEVTEIGMNAFRMRNDIVEQVILPEGLMNISDRAFYGCTKLKSVNIPNGVVNIGDYAFQHCISLEDIILPDTVSQLGKGVFRECSNLKYVTLSQGLTAIPSSAFHTCTSLRYVKIPDSVVTIGGFACYECKNLSHVELNENLKVIDEAAFYECNIKEITIPRNVSNIDNRAFEFCDGLVIYGFPGSCAETFADIRNKTFIDITTPLSFRYETLQDNNVKITEYIGSSLDVSIPEYIYGRKVTQISSSSFSHISNIESLIILPNVNFIEEGAFGRFPNILIQGYEGSYAEDYAKAHDISFVPLGDSVKNKFTYKLVSEGEAEITGYRGMETRVVIPEVLNELSVVGIGDYAFSGKSQITAVEIPDSVQYILSSAFRGCEDLEYVKMPPSLQKIGSHAFYDCKSLKYLDMPDGVKEIGAYAFYGCISLRNIDIPYGITRIEQYTFMYCSSLTDIIIPDTVKTIEWNAFRNCRDLKNVDLGKGLTNLGLCAFCCCENLTDMVIPNGTIVIDENAFYDCVQLKRIFIPESVGLIGEGVFSNRNSNLKIYGYPNSKAEDYAKSNRIDFVSLTSSFGDYDYVLADDEVTILRYLGTDNFVEIPAQINDSNVANIDRMAFYENHVVQEIIIPESVRNINSEAFRNCSSLVKVVIPESVTNIGDNAFYGCSKVRIYGKSGSAAETYALSNGIMFIDIDSYKEDEGFAYREAENGLIEITGYVGTDSNVNVLGQIEGKEVIGIGNRAFAGNETLKVITLPNTITSIGEEAFYRCYGLSEIMIPESVKGIGDRAFYGCTNLIKADISVGIESIGYGAFYQCSRITEIVMPDSLRSIGSEAFRNCSSLGKVVIPESVTNIGDNAFYGCSKVRIYGKSGSAAETYALSNGIMFIDIDSYKEDEGFAYREAENGLIEITGYVGTDSNVNVLGQIEGKEVIGIGNRAFAGNETLKVITLPNTITSIGEEAFYRCYGLSEIMIPESVKGIGDRAFYGCTNLIKADISVGIESIGYGAFYQCSRITEIVMPDSLRSIGSEAFRNCSSLGKVVIPESVTNIGDNAFYGCSKVRIYGKSGSVAETYALSNGIMFIDISLVYGDFTYGILNDTSVEITGYMGTDSNVSIPNQIDGKNVVGISNNAFYCDSQVTQVVIPDRVLSIGESAFYKCINLVSVVVPDSIERVGEYAFYECNSLTNMRIPDGVDVINEYTFYNCNALSKIEISDNVTSIGNYAFYDCYNLSDISLPSNLIDIGEYAFRNCGKILDLEIPNGVKNIRAGAFYWANFTELAIPSSVENIGESAFWNCSQLNEVEISDGTLKTIGARAFGACGKLTKVFIPSTVTSIVDGAFNECDRLKIYSKSGSYVDEYCKRNGIPFVDPSVSSGDFTYEILEDGTVRITSYSGNDNYVEIPENIENKTVSHIGERAFAANDNITKVLVPAGVKSLEDSIFYWCQRLKEVVLPEGLYSIGMDAFYGCRNLAVINIPGTVKDIGYRAFSQCDNLKELFLSANVTNIGKEAFKDCLNLEYVRSSSSSNSNNLKTRSLKAVGNEIGEEAFSGCVNLKSIEIPEGINKIERLAFENCTSLKEIVIPQNVTSIERDAFQGCTDITVYVYSSDLEASLNILGIRCVNLSNLNYEVEGLKFISGPREEKPKFAWKKIVDQKVKGYKIFICSGEMDEKVLEEDIRGNENDNITYRVKAEMNTGIFKAYIIAYGEEGNLTDFELLKQNNKGLTFEINEVTPITVKDLGIYSYQEGDIIDVNNASTISFTLIDMPSERQDRDKVAVRVVINEKTDLISSNNIYYTERVNGDRDYYVILDQLVFGELHYSSEVAELSVRVEVTDGLVCFGEENSELDPKLHLIKTDVKTYLIRNYRYGFGFGRLKIENII